MQSPTLCNWFFVRGLRWKKIQTTLLGQKHVCDVHPSMNEISLFRPLDSSLAHGEMVFLVGSTPPWVFSGIILWYCRIAVIGKTWETQDMGINPLILVLGIVAKTMPLVDRCPNVVLLFWIPHDSDRRPCIFNWTVPTWPFLPLKNVVL